MLQAVSRIALVAAGALLVAACGSSSPAPTPLDLSGTWNGSMTDSVAGPSTIQIVISQSGTTLTGTWTQTYPDPNLNALETQLGGNFGSFTGSTGGNTVALLLAPQRSQACSYPIASTATTSTLNGTWTFDSSCQIVDGGTISLTKQ